MSEILSIGSTPVRDDTIIKKQHVVYDPYTSSYGNNDEIRISIHSQDHYILPSESYLVLELKYAPKTAAGAAIGEAKYDGFFWGYLFSEARYEINNIEIDRVKNPGVTAKMKNLCACPTSRSRLVQQLKAFDGTIITANNLIQFIIPLNMLFGFCDDYNKIIMNAKHELILVRSRNDTNIYNCATDSYDVNISKLRWKVPVVQLSDHARLSMLKYLERKRTISVPYRSWDLYELPAVPQTSKHIWTVKSTSQMNKPRYVFVGFKHNRQAIAADAAGFDVCNISDVRLHLNSETFPYDNFKSHTRAGFCQELYYAFAQIQGAYYPEYKGSNPFPLTYETFAAQPIYAFDCSRTNESLLSGSVDIRLEISASGNIPENTAAYCLIIHENQFEYSPFSGIVVKSV